VGKLVLTRHWWLALSVFMLIGAPAIGIAVDTVHVSTGPNIWTLGIGPREYQGLVTRDMSGNLYTLTGYSNYSHGALPGSTVYRSSDGGQTWSPVGDYAVAFPANASYGVSSVAASADGSVLLIVASTGANEATALFKSTDSGAGWHLIAPRFDIAPSQRIGRIVIDPTSAARMYAIGREAYRSTDGGSTWKSMPALPEEAYYGIIVVDPVRPTHLLAASMVEKSLRMMASEDYGVTWRDVARQTTISSDSDFDLIFVQRQGEQSFILAAGYLAGSGPQVFLSKDGGGSWKRVAATDPAYSLLGIESSQGRLFCMVRNHAANRDLIYTSADGENWTVASEFPVRGSLDFHGQVYYGNRNAFYVSQLDPRRIFRADGMFSADGGETWTGPLDALPLDVIRPNRFVAGPDAWLAENNHALYRSTDKGATWDNMFPYTSAPFGNITGMGQHGSTIFAHLFPEGGSHGGNPEYWGKPVIVRSLDGGATWTTTMLDTHGGETADFVFSATSSHMVYAAVSPTFDSGNGRVLTGGLYKSTDDGATWITLTTGMVTNNLLIDPNSEDHLWAAGDDGLAESHDGGATWSIVHTQTLIGGLIMGDAGSSNTLYSYEILPRRSGWTRFGYGPILQHPGVLHKSTDGGHSWNRLDIAGAPQDYSVQSFTVTGAGKLLVVWSTKEDTEPHYQYRNLGMLAHFAQSPDGGATWRHLDGPGFPDYLLFPIDQVAQPESDTVFVAGLSYRPVLEQPDPAFGALWQRQDDPVQQGKAQRSWTWGPRPFSTIREPLEGLPGNSRVVQYYDKSRMEVNDPSSGRDSPWFVTNGLLVTEMVAGRVQTGLNKWEARAPSRQPVAGNNGPSYGMLRSVATYENGNNKAPSRIGKVIDKQIYSYQPISSEVPITSPLKLAAYDAIGGHNIAAPFWEYLNRKGIVLENGVYVQKPVLGDWLFVMGRPITEPYWTKVSLGAGDKWILIQLFERRVLTYTPTNAPQWQVEMGNVGLHYYLWRYGDVR
jgi:photosystem II stability/assembly factor-like uncharacterized protein